MEIKQKQLMKNTAIVSIGKICTQLITFFLLPLYTAVLSTEQYGVVDLLNTLVSLFLPIVTLQIEQGIFRFLIDKREQLSGQKKIISTSLFVILIQIIVFFVLFIVVSPFIHNNYKVFLVINLIAHIFSAVFLQISRGLGDNFTYALGSFLSGVITVLLNVILIVGFNLGAYGMLLATFIGNSMCALYILFYKRLYKYVRFQFYDKNLAKEILKYSIPLVPNMISWWIVNTSDRSIITFFLGVSANGIYSVSNKFSAVVSTLYSVFNLTWTESASLYINEDDASQFFSEIFDMIIHLFGCLCLGIIAFMPLVFPILVNKKFDAAYLQIPILMIGVLFNIFVSFLGSIYVAKKITTEIAKTSIFAAIINIGINLLFVKFIGLFAASLSTAIAYISMFIYRYIDAKKYVKIIVNKRIIGIMFVAYLFTIASYYMNITLLNIVVAISIFIFSVIINIKYMHSIGKLIKTKIKNK